MLLQDGGSRAEVNSNLILGNKHYGVVVRVVNQFPILRSHGMHLQKRMEKIQNHEQRGDIQTITKRYVALLRACERTWQKASET